jgi:hypothetical protein
MHVERDIELGRDYTRDLGSLVVTALAQPRCMQRHGDERVHGDVATLELIGQ